jgi:predicted ferric reductase
VIVVLALFLWMVFRSLAGTNTAGLQMPAMDLEHHVGYWWPFLMGETLGLAALIWAYLAVLVGLLFSTRRPRYMGLSSRQVNGLHRQLSLTTIALILGHALFVALGGMNDAMTERTISFSQGFLPFQTSWNQWPYAFGIFSMYLAVLIGPTYYIRGRIGVRAWKVVHRLSAVVYVLAVVHTFSFDDFDFDGPYRLALWAAQIPLGAMLLWRLGSPVRSGRRAAQPTKT